VAIVRDLLIDGLVDIGAYAPGDPVPAPDIERALRLLQGQIDSWAADRLTLSVQSRLAVTWPSSTDSQTIGPSGDIVAQRPVWINQLNYVIPGSSPAVEVPIGAMDQDSYAAQTIKDLSSSLPTAFFYQTSIDTVLGTITLWPVPNQALTLYLYAPQAVTVPVSLTDVLIGPPGYYEAFLYQFEERALHTFGIKDESILNRVLTLSTQAYARMKRPNNDPGLLGVDAALAPSTGGGYNILSDVTSGFTR